VICCDNYARLQQKFLINQLPNVKAYILFAEGLTEKTQQFKAPVYNWW
jgi:hypothetical protein